MKAIKPVTELSQPSVRFSCSIGLFFQLFRHRVKRVRFDVCRLSSFARLILDSDLYPPKEWVNVMRSSNTIMVPLCSGQSVEKCIVGKFSRSSAQIEFDNIAEIGSTLVWSLNAFSLTRLPFLWNECSAIDNLDLFSPIHSAWMNLFWNFAYSALCEGS